MAHKGKHELLAQLKRNKRNRSVQDAWELLEAFGFQYRPASREQGGLWRRGAFTVTLPLPHGSGDRSLSPKYINMIIRIIELAEATDAEEEDSE